MLKVGFVDGAHGHTHDLSASGAFIRGNSHVEVGDTVALELSFPGLLKCVHLEGVVRRVQTFEEDGTCGFGLEWSSAPSEVQSVLRAMGEQNPWELADAKTYRVLVADDNRVFRELVGRAVQRLQAQTGGHTRFDLVEAADGAEAWRVLQRERIDLAVLDIYMPNMDGMQLLDRIRTHHRLEYLPVVMIAPRADNLRRDMLQAGADFVVDKPLRLFDLLETITALLKYAEAREAL